MGWFTPDMAFTELAASGQLVMAEPAGRSPRVDAPFDVAGANLQVEYFPAARHDPSLSAVTDVGADGVPL